MRTSFISGSPPPVSNPVDPPGRSASGGPAAPVWRGLMPLHRLTGLTGEERASLHRTNVRIRERDAQDYSTYLDDYLAGARRCRTVDELRAYGPPARPESGLERGATRSEDADLERPYRGADLEWRRAHADIYDVVCRLERRPVPLDLFFGASVTAKIELGGRTYGGTLSSRGDVTPQIGAAGVTIEPGRTEVGVDAGVAGVKAAFAGGRLESVEACVLAVPGVRACAKQSDGAIEEGIAVGGKLGATGGPKLHLEGKASVGVNLLTAEDVRRALFGRWIWDGERK